MVTSYIYSSIKYPYVPMYHIYTYITFNELKKTQAEVNEKNANGKTLKI